MSFPHGWRPHIEAALCLNLRRMLDSRALCANTTTSGIWHWVNDDGVELGAIRYMSELGATEGILNLSYAIGNGDERRDVTCQIKMDTVPIHYGGERWYFRCPYTHRRALKLYKWPTIDLFCHRDSIRPRPTYASQRVGGCDRIMAQRWAIRRKLGDHFSDLLGEPFKPKGMHWRTFERHCRRDNNLAKREFAYLAQFFARFRFSIDDL